MIDMNVCRQVGRALRLQPSTVDLCVTRYHEALEAKAAPHWQVPAMIELDEKGPGIELLHLRSGTGGGTESLHIENGLSNGLRLLVLEEDWDSDKGDVVKGSGKYSHFHIGARSTARLIARTLIEWADRIADPPKVKE